MNYHQPLRLRQLLTITNRRQSISFYSTSTNQNKFNQLKLRLKNTKTNWKPIPIWIGASLLGVLTYIKKNQSTQEEEQSTTNDRTVKIEGPWQVHVLGALPLRSISRYTDYLILILYLFGLEFLVTNFTLDEAEIHDLTQFKSLNEFFMRKLRDDCRPVDSHAILTSPADGKIINFGTIEGPNETKRSNEEESQVRDSEFAKINDITYSVEELMGGSQEKQDRRSSTSSEPINDQEEGPSLVESVKVQTDILRGQLESLPSSGNRMFFFVVYLAPGDYHRFHSPADWKVERRRHFPGHISLDGRKTSRPIYLERKGLIDREMETWVLQYDSRRSYNVGSILINFDSELRTNRVDMKSYHEELIYTTGKGILDGQILSKGDEVGAFSLGSTIVLVFEAPNHFSFSVKKGEPVRVGQAIGNV
ncbi:hypothetical protein KEM48_004156 [Puccinia striiformis f. sp. tritici PST-130]|nr:hypothetical protein KEM48_004156 [Puccinia striiformis f. sp. tritici PST-130]